MNEKELLNHYLLENNLRQTPERYIILKYIYQISNHFDIDFLYNSINKKEFSGKIFSLSVANNTIKFMLYCFRNSRVVYFKQKNEKLKSIRKFE